MASKTTKKSAVGAETTKSVKKTSKPKKVSSATAKKTTSKRKAKNDTVSEKVAPKVSAEKPTEQENTGAGMARFISNSIGKYFSKFVVVAMALTLGLSSVTGCAVFSNMTTEQKADIAFSASRTATIAWVVLDEKSTKYVDSLSSVVSITKEAVYAFCSETNTSFEAGFYDKCFAVVDKRIDELGLDPIESELSKSLAKFSILECQKVVKLLKSQTPEETKEIVKAIIDGIDSGLKINVASEEYKTALVAKDVSDEDDALRVKMSIRAKKTK